MCAQETKRGCGWRRVGGYYLVGTMGFLSCDRLPIQLDVCPVCGAGIHFARGMARVNPLKLWGRHQKYKAQTLTDGGQTFTEQEHCICVDGCSVCDPTDKPAFIMFVGEKFYTVQEFISEARTMGISKRIPPHYPAGLKLGETVIYLAHKHCIREDRMRTVQRKVKLTKDVGDGRLINVDGVKDVQVPVWSAGVFCAFIPTRVEKCVWEEDYTPEAIAQAAKQGVTLVPFKQDADHAPSEKEENRTGEDDD